MYEERANLRAAIDASPLWDVDVATRKALFQPMLKKLNGREESAGDDPAEAAAVDPKLEETYKRVWAECFELFPTEDATILSMAFFQAAAAYQPDPTREKDSFCAYMQMAMRHLKAEDARKEAQSLGIMDVSKETARKVRQALDYMDRMGYTSAMVTGDPHLEKTVAQAARIGQRSLHEALLNKDTLVSINTERDDGTGIEIVDTGLSPEDGLELKEDMFPRIHKALLLMSLEEKEKTRANMVLFWSPRILGYLRKNEAPDMPERLGRCDDLRPLEWDGILWDQLVLRDYVRFCVRQPLYSGEGPENPKELESAAVNPLLLPTRRPEQDKTVAEYLGKDKGTISYHNKNLNKKFRELLGIKDTKPVKEN